MINSDQPVQIDAASGKFFVLRKLSGETVVAKPTTPPVGWTEDNYFETVQQIPGGKWIVSEGNPVILITSPQQVTTQVIPKDPTSSDALMGIMGFMVWIVGLLVFSILGLYN